jgi:hypothetical protein
MIRRAATEEGLGIVEIETDRLAVVGNRAIVVPQFDIGIAAVGQRRGQLLPSKRFESMTAVQASTRVLPAAPNRP